MEEGKHCDWVSSGFSLGETGLLCNNRVEWMHFSCPVGDRHWGIVGDDGDGLLCDTEAELAM